MTKKLALAIIALSFASVATAQAPPGLAKKTTPIQSNISLKIAGLGCTTKLGSNTFSAIAYSFEASQETSSSSGAGSAAGKATVLPLNVKTTFDECSPALFGGVVTGKRFATADLFQQDDKGNPILTINLTEVFIGSYRVGGAESSDTPEVSIQLEFRKICISEPSNNSTLCFDRATNTAF
jgi:type VI protein secretion system component Hcp